MAMLASDSSMHPSPSGVEEMEYEEVINLMKYLNIKSTESGERDRVLLKNYLYAERWIGSYEDKIQDTVNKIMKKYVAEKNRLRESYLEIKQMASTDAFNKELSPSVEERFPKYMEQLQERITKLTTDDIEICIIGWTCAGKSTFFNILLGVDIMPTNVLPDTPCLIRLHNSQTRKIQYEDEGKKFTVHLTDDPQDAKRQLKAMFDQRGGNDQTTLDVLDLYWPVPGMHENVVFVDTPGIGEKDSLTQLVMKHVPNAAGYICIINSVDGGGILEGGVRNIMQRLEHGVVYLGSMPISSSYLKQLPIESVKLKKKLGNVLFICNKWDMIKRQDRQAVSEDTRKKLRLYFGVVEDWQIIHFSASVELQLRQLRASPTDDFLKIIGGMETLVSRTVKNLFFDFFGWIKNVIGKSMAMIDTKMSLLLLSSAELVKLTIKTAKNLEETKLKLESKSKNLETMVDTMKSEIIKDLQAYLKSSQVQKKAGDWKQTNLKAKPSEIVMERIHMLISEWAEKEEGVLKKAIADVEKEYIYFATDIDKCLNSIDKMKMDCCPVRTVDKYIAFGMSVLPFVIAIPSGPLAMTITFAIASIAFVARIIFCFRDETSQLTKLTLEILKQISNDECTGNLISTLFERPMKNLIEQFRSTMQCEIASRQKLFQKLSADVQCSTDFQSTLKSLFNELNKCLMHLEKIGVEYYSDDSISYECLSIDRSPVSATEMFHLHDVANLIEGKSFSLQVINPGYSVFQLRAIPELKLLIQKSIGNLEQFVFTNQSVQGRYSGESTADFFQKMTLGIANGLSYVHEMGFVHGHLQLSSILLAENMTPKLCHINVLPSLQERNHSICIFHTAPEVINGGKYGPEADIYSLGILLWELWYGRHTPPGMNLTVKSVIHGVRPKFEEKYPEKGWIGMMQLCWNDSLDRRPSAAACVRTSSNVV